MSNRAKLVNPFCYNPRITAQYIVCTSDFMPFDEKSISQFESNFMTWHNNYIPASFVLLQCNSSFQAFSCFTVKHFRVSSFLFWRIFDLIRLEILNEILLSCFINLAIFLEKNETKLQLRSRLLHTDIRIYETFDTNSIAKENIHEFLNISLSLNKV